MYTTKQTDNQTSRTRAKFVDTQVPDKPYRECTYKEEGEPKEKGSNGYIDIGRERRVEVETRKQAEMQAR